MLTKIMTALLLALLGVIAVMAVSHRSAMSEADEEVKAARADLNAANEAKGAATTRAETAEGINKANAAYIATLNSDLLLQKEVTRQQQDRADGIQANYDQLHSQYQEALQHDPQTRDWASTPLPDSVSSGRLLYRAKADARTQGGDGGGVPPGAGANPGNATVPDVGGQTTR